MPFSFDRAVSGRAREDFDAPDTVLRPPYEFLCRPTLLFSQNFNATTELQLGIAAYEKSKYWDAIDHLERAVTLDPSAITAHLGSALTFSVAIVQLMTRM